MSRELARDVLDSFLFGNVHNNRNRHEDTWDINFMGDEYLVYNHDTKEMFNFQVIIGPGSLERNEMLELAQEQEWDIEDED